MNKLLIIGNLTADPVQRTTQTGKTVSNFTIAVNRRGQKDAVDFFRVSAWEKLGENCQKYLKKGRKVAVVGRVSVGTYEGQDGKTRASLEVVAEDVEFLSDKKDENSQQVNKPDDGYSQVYSEDLPF